MQTQEHEHGAPIIDEGFALSPESAATSEAVVAEDRLLPALRTLWSVRRRLARTAAIGFVFATAVAFLIPKTYVSTTRLMPPDSQSTSNLASLASIVGKLGGGIGAIAGDITGIKSSGAMFVGVLHSRTVTEALVKQFDLRSVYGYPWLHLRASEERALRKLSNNTDVTEDKKSGIITISVVDHNPQRAQSLAHAYADQLDKAVAHFSTSSAKREREFLEERLKSVKQELDAASKALSEFSSRNATIDPKEQGKEMVAAAATLQGHLIAAESELKGLQAVYTDNNVRVRSLRARIAELKSQISTVSGSRTGKDAASAMEYPSIRQLPLLGAIYADYYRRAKIQEVVFETLTQQYELAKVQEVKEVPTVRVLDPAELPERRTGPPRLAIMILGLVLGFCFGGAWVLGKAEWDKTSPEEPYKAFVIEIASSLRRHRLWTRTETTVRRLNRWLSEDAQS